VLAALERFVMEFEVCHEIEGEVVSEKVYRAQLNELEVMEATTFSVDGRHIKEFDRELYLQFIFFPAEMISCFDDLIKELFEKYFIEPETDPTTRANRRHRRQSLMMEIRHLDD
jgi:DNA replicative helicase MCM subunit Mcm2 (Cdc46/Mcm family)